MAEEIINNENENIENENENTEVKTYTQEEMDALIDQKVQSLVDQRVTQALKTQQKKYDKKLSLSKLDDEARAKAESEDRIKELEEQLAQMNIDKARSDLKSTLAARGLDPRFADLLNITDDVDSNQKVISTFDKIWKAAITDSVNKRLAEAETPKQQVASTRKEEKRNIRDIPLNELLQMWNDNPDEFK